MLNIQKISNIPSFNKTNRTTKQDINTNVQTQTVPKELKTVNSSNILAYFPSFKRIEKNSLPSQEKQLQIVKSKINKKTQAVLKKLQEKGILADNKSNDGSTVLENLYKIATEPRIIGLSTEQILSDVINAIDNPYSITQKFGDIPKNVASEIEQETGNKLPHKALNVTSSCCVVASMEFTLANKMPAEFVRFANGLSGKNYSVDKNIKMSDIDDNYISSINKLKIFNTEHKIDKNWNDVTVRIKPDRNAIVRARIQNSYKDPGERSCIDVLIQSALLNLGSQNTYDAMTDERTGELNTDNTGLTDFEKTFVENIVFGTPKLSVVYQQIDENGNLIGYNAKPEETKQHIIKSLELGQNVIIGYVYLDNNKVVGGHEITIVDYKEDANGNGYFVCNDTDDNLDKEVILKADELIPLIHHAGISKEALNKDDIILEPWREILEQIKPFIR